MVDVGAFGSGLLTGLREGVEAALIVSIVIAYLVRTGHRQDVPAIWLGTAAAAALSLALGWLVFVTVGDLPSPYEQAFEATTMLVAAGIVTGMLFWMRRQAGAIKGTLLRRMDRVIGEGGVLGLAILAFTSVIREGIETALFLVGQVTAAAHATGGASSVLLGALVGLLAASILGLGFYRGSHRLNLGSFFRWTGIGLVFVAAGLLSRAIQELIEIHVITVGARTVFDLGGILPDDAGLGAFLRAIIGYSSAPQVVTLAAYVTYLAVVLTLYLRPLPAPRLPLQRATSQPPSDEAPTVPTA